MKKNIYHSYHQQAGFTLVEVLVTTLLIVALAIGVLGLQYILGQSQTLAWKSYINVDQANSNIQTMVRELRTSKDGDNGAYPLEVVNDQVITFYSDIDFDGEAEKVRYFLNGTNFSKGVIEPTEPPVIYPSAGEKIINLSNYVRNGSTPIFTYYNGDWPQDTQYNPLTSPVTPSQVKLVGIYIRLNQNPNESNKDFILQSSAQIRMLKENL